MAGRANGERVLGDDSDERLRQSLKDMKNGKTRKRRNKSTEGERGVDLDVD